MSPKHLFLTFLSTFASFAFAAPTVSTLVPVNGSAVSSFSSLSVTFNESVTGVDAADLEINGSSASAVNGGGAGPYVFTFTQPAAGTVSVIWETDHNIAGINTGPFVAPGAWTFTLSDTIAPTLALTTPTAGATLTVLTQAEVQFSELVGGVDASDLLVNGTPATAVTGSGAGPYVFNLAQPATGAVNFTWAGGHGITDFSDSANPFAGAGWSVTVGATSSVVINEFLAQNGLGIADEDLEQNDWIELLNTGGATVNLAGWSLTNDVDEPSRWVLPSRTIASGATLRIFASGKDRKPVSGNLHTNFKLNENGGTLQLLTPDSPRTITTPNFAPYPPQRVDYSYGRGTGGALFYFTPPTPDAANAAGTLTALAASPTVSVSRGFFKDPFTVVLSCATAGATIRYTLDGSVPTAASTAYTVPLSVSNTTLLRVVTFATNFVPSATITHSYIFLDSAFAQASPPYDNPANGTDNANPQPPSVGGVTLPVHWGTAANFQNTNPATTGYVPFANLPASNSVPADYGMDAKVVNDPNLYDDNGNISPSGITNLQRMKESLRTLPILSVVMPSGEMFGPVATFPNALYPNSSETPTLNKPDRTTPCSLEMLLPDASTAFATTCGIDIHGNASRAPYKNPKHGFTLKFKGDYGPGTLDYKLFPDSPVRSFDKLVLRADFNSSWRHQDGGVQRPKETRVRDAWSKDTFRAMGRGAGHHRYTNLFINGIYWGTYDLAEDQADDFAASYFGGKKADYDVFDQGVLKSGTTTAYYAMKATLGWTGATYTTAPTAGVLGTAFSNAEYETLKGQLDVPWFIDYMIQHYYVGHEDWGTTSDYNKNWYAVRNATAGGKFRFLPWDQENLLYSETQNRVTGAAFPPVAAQNRLRTNAQFALDFADQVHKHMVSPDGALLPAASITRFNKWTSIMNAGAMALESARWGDYRRDVHRYTAAATFVYTWNGKWFETGATQTTATHWLAELTRLNGTYFPVRTANVVGQFRAAPVAPILALYPSVNAPEIRDNATNIAIASQRVAAGFVVKFANVNSLPGGTVNASTFYYTTNGTDPRVYYTGAIAGTAIAPNATLTINSTTTLKVRALNAGTWSALNEQTFTVGNESLIPTVRITELMYNPPGNTNDDAKEFIELRNIGTQPVDMSGWFFGGVDCVIPMGTVLNAGDHFVLASNDSPAVFAATYPGVAVGAYFGGQLDNGSERVSLHDATGRTIMSVEYNDHVPWPLSPDGGGPSLEIIDANGDANSRLNWKASNTNYGTPGAVNSTLAAQAVRISEFFVKNGGAYTTGGVNPGYVELFNSGGTSVNVGGLVLEAGFNTSFILPSASIPAGGYLLVHWSPISLPGPCVIGPLGDSNYLRLRTSADTFIDGVQYGPQATDFSFSRIGGVWTLSTPTPGAAGVAAPVAAQSSLRLNEWLANPTPGFDDWLELANTSATLPVSLPGLYVGETGELFRIAALSAIAPSGYTQFTCNSGGKGGENIGFNLPTSGTTLTLADSAGTQFDTLTFTAQTEGVSQGRLPNGTGPTVTLPYPSPALANYAALTNQPVLNEILIRNINGDNAPFGERARWFELKNPAGSAVNLTGWKLRNPNLPEVAWTVPSGVTIAAGGYLPVWSTGLLPGSTSNVPHLIYGTAYNAQLYVAGAIELVNPAGQIADRIQWDENNQLPDQSIGRISDGSWQLLTTPTRGAANSGAAPLGPLSALRINEWSDFIEFYNTSALPVAIGGLYLSDDPSEVGRRKARTAPLGFIAANGFGLAYPSSYGFSIAFTGESLRLAQSDDTLLDAVNFGPFTYPQSLGRTPDGTAAIANSPVTAGLPNVQGTGPWITGMTPSGGMYYGGAMFVQISAINTTSYQWYRNGTLIPGATQYFYGTYTNADSTYDGTYTCVLTGPGGTLTSPPITITLIHTFDTWTDEHGIPGATTDGDADGDGIKNLAEFLANTNPTIAATAAERTAHQVVGTLELSAGVPTFQTLDFRLNRRAAFTGFGVDISPDVTAWTPATPDLSELVSTEPNGDQHWRLKFAVPGGTAKRFLRLNIAE